MKTLVDRRRFLGVLLGGSAFGGAACRTTGPAARDSKSRPGRFLFVSQGHSAIMNVDGTGLRYFDFQVPNQATWQPAGLFADGRRILFLSMEPRRDGPGRPFEEYYTQTPTHLWIHELESGALTEIATRDRLAVFYTPELLLSDERLLVQVVRNRVGQIFSMNLDGTDAREFTRAGEGLPYGLSLSPDGRRVAFHLASPSGYQIWTCDVTGGDRKLIAGHADLLFFGPRWSPDGEWLAYQGCQYRQDPGHDWSDLWICRADGRELRRLTDGQSQWFAATYGNPENRGGGSNMLAWTRDGALLFSRRLPAAKVPWEFQPQRPDTDHFNRDFRPDEARGGTEICRLDPRNGATVRLTQHDPPVWDCRASESPDGRHVLFCRAETGRMPGIWVMDANGANPRLLTAGWDGRGADHPRWLPA